ncbi:hypothetical protein Q7C36_017265 [Tachysurus vachellii]|uniref:Uncharacterized protein n=1 Tax=Tachysurus vachellii TaxID=175792 RepID=A0AA88M5M3_TACVA|nr:hypothetical protein Q7C36_017265 [Tachysurus vachellii]
MDVTRSQRQSRGKRTIHGETSRASCSLACFISQRLKESVERQKYRGIWGSKQYADRWCKGERRSNSLCQCYDARGTLMLCAVVEQPLFK